MRWKVSPIDFLRGYEEELFSRLQAKVENGEITISREANELIDPKEEQLQIHEKLFNFLTSISLIHKKIRFSLIPTGLEIESEGTRYLNAEVGIYCLSGMEVDFILTKNDGQTVINSKKERLAKQQELFELINNYGADQVASKILDSYRYALEHDEKILSYLYEILEALKNCFGNKKNAIQKLNLSSKQWEGFGKLANDPRIRQGRHYSEISVNSRDITDTERDFALSFGQTMIENYLKYLQQNKKK